MIVVQQGQSIFDVAIQHCGDATAAFEIARLNGFSGITQQIAPGQLLEIPDAIEPAIVKFLSDNNVVPATGDLIGGQNPTLEGIDYWGIEYDFIIS